MSWIDPALTDAVLADVAVALTPAPRPRRAPPPLHVVYGGAHLFKSDTAVKLARIARASFDDVVPTAEALARVFALDDALAVDVWPRVRDGLARAVEDLRVDFEDGFGPRDDAEEDDAARAAAGALAAGLAAGTLPPRIGVRPKALGGGTARRAMRTLDLFFAALAEYGAALPPGFVVTLPKVQHAGSVAALGRVLDDVERRLGVAAGSIELELMLETPRAVLDDAGHVAIGALVDAGQGRVESVHLGAFDLLGALDVPARASTLAHPTCALVRGLAKLALAGRGVDVVDGVTTVMPVGPHRAAPGAPLDERRAAENRVIVGDALRVHADHVRAALDAGITRGWDLHPAQIVARRVAVTAALRAELPQALARLKGFLDEAMQAVRRGTAFDDAASAQGLWNTLALGRRVGAVDDDELAALGIAPAALTGSFADLVDARRGSTLRP